MQSRFPQEIIDRICLYLPLEKAWHFSKYSAQKIYKSKIHNCEYWTSINYITILHYFLENNLILLSDRKNIVNSACTKNRIDILDLIIKHGSYPEINKSIMYIASYCDNVDVLKFLISKNFKLNFDYTPLCMIVQYGNYKVIKFLIENNFISNKNDTYLITASCSCYEYPYLQNVKILRLLLKHGYDPTYDENTWAIVLASELGSIEMVQLLLDYGADPTYQNNCAIETAYKKNHNDVAQLLLRHGCVL